MALCYFYLVSEYLLLQKHDKDISAGNLHVVASLCYRLIHSVNVDVTKTISVQCQIFYKSSNICFEGAWQEIKLKRKLSYLINK